ncbi:MAG: hypothetical protein HOP19_20925 [Acidobacteria bacterium]|nr:hypothetical protein [Acidobacteriota bacterium]
MSTQTRLAKIESVVEGACPICGTDRREQRVQKIEFWTKNLKEAATKLALSLDEAYDWLRENVPAFEQDLRQDSSIAATALMNARAL